MRLVHYIEDYWPNMPEGAVRQGDAWYNEYHDVIFYNFHNEDGSLHAQIPVKLSMPVVEMPLPSWVNNSDDEVYCEYEFASEVEGRILEWLNEWKAGNR